MIARPVAPGIWRLPFESNTLPPFDHTNGWLIVADERAVLVDPGFRADAGIAMLEGAMAGAGASNLQAVWLTHTHQDHCEGLATVCGRWIDVDVWAHAREADRVDVGRPIRPLEDGAELRVGNRSIRALHTPGHSPGHVAFHVLDTRMMLVGDLLAGSGSVWVGTPEGDVADYLRSLDRIAAQRPAALGPGHGDPIRDPGSAIRTARDHRVHREHQIVASLRRAPAGMTVGELRAAVYPQLEPGMAALAERSLEAHLRKLVAEGRAARAADDPKGPYLLLD